MLDLGIGVVIFMAFIFITGICSIIDHAQSEVADREYITAKTKILLAKSEELAGKQSPQKMISEDEYKEFLEYKKNKK